MTKDAAQRRRWTFYEAVLNRRYIIEVKRGGLYNEWQE